MSTISAILRAVQDKSGVDFSCYRAPTVERRIHNRMISLGIRDLASYRGLLEQSEQETHQLIERITIKVSRFYRNRDVFDTLRHTVLPELRQATRPLRVWSAGCGRGEEPYTLAMLLEEAGLPGSITATDIDSVALAEAANAVYRADAASELPDDLRDRFLLRLKLRSGEGVAVPQSLKSRVRLQQADLTALSGDAPQDCDLVCCRNVLIYWSADRQRQILRTLVASLRTGGVLCIGEAEWPDASNAVRLEPLGGRLRMFRKTAGHGE